MYQFPRIVNLEVYRGACPCRCVHCPVGRTEPGRRKDTFGEGTVDMGLYARIVEQMSAYPWAVLRVHSVGEPVLWPELPRALAISRQAGVKSWVFTSAVTRDKALLEALCRSADIIEVSVNSTTAGDYAATKGIDAFDLVFENIAYMHKLRTRGVQMRTIVSRVQSPDAAADEQFPGFWQATGLVDDAFVRSYHTYNDLLPGLARSAAGPKHQPCLVHWARLNVSLSGKVVVCFNELFKDHVPPELILGDLNSQSIVQVWQGGPLAALRKADLAGDFSALPGADALPCLSCTSCQPLYGTGPTSEHQVDHLLAAGRRSVTDTASEED